MHHSTPSLPRPSTHNSSTMEQQILSLRAFGASPRPPSILQTIEEPLWILLNADLAVGTCAGPRWSCLGAPPPPAHVGCYGRTRDARKQGRRLTDATRTRHEETA